MKGQSKYSFPFLSQTCINAISENWSHSNKTLFPNSHVSSQTRTTVNKLPFFYYRPSVSLSVKNRYVGLFSVQSFCLQRGFFFPHSLRNLSQLFEYQCSSTRKFPCVFITQSSKTSLQEKRLFFPPPQSFDLASLTLEKYHPAS